MAVSGASQIQSPTAFYYLNDHFCCENTPVHQIENELEKTTSDENDCRPATPLYIYSQAQLHRNIQGYKDAIQSAKMHGRIHIFYAIKANPNLHLMELVRKQDCGAVTVSGYELQAALNTGFVPGMILLNGNGKQMLWEIRLALKNGCMLNIDSLFDAENIISVARELQKTARVLIRVNPGLEQSSTPVHSYLSTALKNSKFGIPLHQFDQVLELLKAEHLIQVVGLHCHVGSTIRDATIYSTVTRILLDIRQKMASQGFKNLKYLDIGGGLGIDYYHGTNQEQSPLSSKDDLIQAIASLLPPDVEVIIEPGRSIMANTGILVTKILGIKKSPDGGKQFVVVDAAMNDLIRPSFYQAYHHVVPVRKTDSPSEGIYDIVGPICESGDFLAVDRCLPQQPVKGELLAIMDIGAYGMAMASNYNMRGRAIEVIVDGNNWKIIRRRENFESLTQTMLN